jgi:hypothetical protein
LADAVSSDDFKQATVVSLYLLPDAVATLRPHLDAALRRGVKGSANHRNCRSNRPHMPAYAHTTALAWTERAICFGVARAPQKKAPLFRHAQNTRQRRTHGMLPDTIR